MSYLKGKIISITGDRIEVRCLNGQVVSLPVSSYDGVPVEHQEVAVMVLPVGGEAAGQQKIAKSLLNELLNTSASVE